MVLSKSCGADRSPARLLVLAMCAAILVLTGVGLQAEVPGTATLSGTVTASQPFTAAQVYVRNVDRGIVYMVYTNGGASGPSPCFPAPTR